MTPTQQFIIELLKEIGKLLAVFMAGWGLPQAPWAKKKDPKDDLAGITRS
jgi:hypothetical protein